IAAGCVNDTFGFSRRTARVKHEQRMLGFQSLSRTYPGHFGHLVMPPEIARRSHVYRFARTFVYNDTFNGRRAGERLIGIFLQRHNGASPISSIRSDQDARLRIILQRANPIRELSSRVRTNEVRQRCPPNNLRGLLSRAWLWNRRLRGCECVRVSRILEMEGRRAAL